MEENTFPSYQREKIAALMQDAWFDGAARLLELTHPQLNLAAARVNRLVKSEFSNITPANVRDFITHLEVVLFHLQRLQDEVDFCKRQIKHAEELLKPFTNEKGN